MWLKLVVINVLLLIQRTKGEDDCPFTVSVLDVPGVRCVPVTPCSGTYYPSGLAQGVGACPTGSSCALLPLTPIMGCAVTGRTDLVYVKTDGTLMKDGKLVTVMGDPVSTTQSPTISDSTTSSTTKRATDSSSTRYSANDSSTSKNSATDSSSTINSATDSSTRKSATDNSTNNLNNELKKNPSSSKLNGNSEGSGLGESKTKEDSNDETNATDLTLDSDGNKLRSVDNRPVTLSMSESGSDDSVGSDAANQQATFNPGSILSDGPTLSKSSLDGGLGLGAIIAIVVGCLAVVAIAAGARLLKKGKEADLATPEAAGGHEAYNNVDGGGSGGMTPKENVLLL
ncbi:unnamed protein product [Peronospora belbahrii]|uniref:Uncharacterized protein n=1 Tax=Peronospora belbahrii TaxID=622444 RepID=A0AAU9L1N7_9STRA|nr:unnamed protein product [Peronospora belbahrii]CAH0514448.1 unnamed protein product [Peronospora belbahrii]